MAERNIQDGISMLQAADGVLVISESDQNQGTCSTSWWANNENDLQIIQNEISQIKDE